MHSMPPSSFFPYHFAPCASTTSDCKEEMATTPGRDLYIAKQSETMPKPKFNVEKLCHGVFSKFGHPYFRPEYFSFRL